jgi:hypothetical protein
MLIIGCDFHTRYQQIAMAREETSESLVERRLDHESGEAHVFYQSFYRSLQDLHERENKVRIKIALALRVIHMPVADSCIYSHERTGAKRRIAVPMTSENLATSELTCSAEIIAQVRGWLRQ